MLRASVRGERSGENKKGRSQEKRRGVIRRGKEPGTLGLLTISRAHEGGRKAAR